LPQKRKEEGELVKKEEKKENGFSGRWKKLRLLSATWIECLQILQNTTFPPGSVSVKKKIFPSTGR